MGSISGKTVIPQDVDGNEQMWGTTVAEVTGASGSTLIGQVASVKHRIFRISISVDTAGLVAISDCGIDVYLPANGTYTWDFGSVGIKQTTANTDIDITNAGGGNVTGYAIYKADA